MKWTFSFLIVSTLITSCYSQGNQNKTNTMDPLKKQNPVYSKTDTSKVVMKEEEWKKVLSPEVYYIARQKGTERPFTSKFETSKEVGTYYYI